MFIPHCSTMSTWKFSNAPEIKGTLNVKIKYFILLVEEIRGNHSILNGFTKAKWILQVILYFQKDDAQIQKHFRFRFRRFGKVKVRFWLSQTWSNCLICIILWPPPCRSVYAIWWRIHDVLVWSIKLYRYEIEQVPNDIWFIEHTKLFDHLVNYWQFTPNYSIVFFSAMVLVLSISFVWIKQMVHLSFQEMNVWLYCTLSLFHSCILKGCVQYSKSFLMDQFSFQFPNEENHFRTVYCYHNDIGLAFLS